MNKKLLLITFTLFCLKVYAQAPVITGISAYSAVPGSTVTITGYYFGTTVASNTVWFQTAKATIISATFVQLVVRVPYGASYGQISVTTGGLTTYSTFDFTPTFLGDSTQTNLFNSAYANIYLTPGTSNAYIAGVKDIDLDGKPDIIAIYTSSASTIPQSAKDSSIMIFQNNLSPGGTVSTSTFPLVKLLNSPTNIVANFNLIDMDGDGKLDLIFNARTDTIYIFRNISVPGVINFSPVVKIPCPSLYNFIVGDMDNDGKPDFILDSGYFVSYNHACGDVYIVKNNYSSGTFSASSFSSKIFITTTPIIHTNVPNSIIYVRDLNGDSKPEIISFYSDPSGTNFTTNDSIFIYQNNVPSSGSIDSTMFSSPIIFRTYNNFSSSLFQDLDMDGKPEMVFGNGFYGINPLRLSVFKNLVSYPGASITTSSFASKVVYDFSSNYSCNTYSPGGLFQINDLTGNGKADLIQYVGLTFFNNGQGNIIDSNTFSQRVCNGFGLMYCDLDSDGRADAIGYGYTTSKTLAIEKGNRIFRKPTIQDTSLTITSRNSNSITLSWTSGNGQGRILLARVGTSIPAGDTPVSYINGIYVAGSVFGTNTQIGSTGTYLVYMGNGSSATVTGLSPSTNYSFKLYEYNGNATGLAYLVQGAPSISNSTLPVSLTSFTADKQNENVLLKWQTASELNNNYFAVQRSVDGSQFTAIGKVKGNGTSNVVNSYQFTDVSAPLDMTGALYYRLRQVDYDGKSTLSDVRVINLNQTNTNWNIYPNPATNELHIVQSAISNQQLAVSLFDITGKQIISTILFTNSTTINTSSFNQGLYFVRITDADGAIVKVQKVAVSK